jgi:hypothetical protein
MEAASKLEPQWTGMHVWTIDYLDMHQKARAKRGSWFHSDPFMIGGQEFTLMVSGDGFEKGDHTPFGVFMCPSKHLSGCLLTSFKIHLRFPGADPLPSGQTACKDFWEDEQKGGALGYNWGFQIYSPSVTHRDLHDRSSPYYQSIGGRVVVVVEVRCSACFATIVCIVHSLAVLSQNMQGLRGVHSGTHFKAVLRGPAHGNRTRRHKKSRSYLLFEFSYASVVPHSVSERGCFSNPF